MLPQELWDEINAAQEYIAALAAHDLQGSGLVYLSAALNLATDDPYELQQALADWQSFSSPAQQHLHALTPEWPITWGSVQDLYHASLVGNHIQQLLGTTAPVTLWLTTCLRGGVRRSQQGHTLAADSDENNTDPDASASH